MDSATTTPAVPVEVPEGTDFAYAFAVFYCRRSQFEGVAAQLVEHMGATVKPRFDPRTGERIPGDVEWIDKGIKCSLNVAPIFHPLYEEPQS